MEPDAPLPPSPQPPEPQLLLPAPPSYPLLGPAPRITACPDLPLHALIEHAGEALRGTGPDAHGDLVRQVAVQLNQTLVRDGSPVSFYAYPTEGLERLCVQLAYQGRSAASDDDGAIWRQLARAVGLALQQREP